MTQRTNLELTINQPTDITLLYDEAIHGQAKYGTAHPIAVSVDGQEYSFFQQKESSLKSSI